MWQVYTWGHSPAEQVVWVCDNFGYLPVTQMSNWTANNILWGWWQRRIMWAYNGFHRDMEGEKAKKCNQPSFW